MNDQFGINRKYAKSTLGLEEDTLTHVQNLMQRSYELVVSAGNGAYGNPERGYVASELRSIMQEMVGLANTQDGNGNYLFSGYQGGTQPFSITSGAGAPVAYNGDQGQRLVQIGSSRSIPVSDSGLDIFMNVRNGNGTFVTAPGAGNTGTGVINSGTVLNPAAWNAATGNTAPTYAKDFRIVFATDNTVSPAVRTYDIVAATSMTVNSVVYNPGDSLITGAPSATTASGTGGALFPRTYTSGSTISLSKQTGDTNPANWDLGATVLVEGEPSGVTTVGGAWPIPAGADQFSVKPSTNESIFKTLDDMATLLETPVRNDPVLGPADRARLANGINTALAKLTGDLDKMSTIRASVGTRLKEVDSFQETGEDLALQYKKTLSELEDLDVAAAISQLAQQQVTLEAAQKAYTRVTGLTLFNYM